ncbi:hypothetical protein L6164_030773 [Bauhinia variegata]|nr:hypothetical protein L6164_030773 [Bauhinia variegata]
MKTQYCQNQLANMLSSEGNATIYQSLDEQIGIEFPQALGDLEDHLFGESNPIPLENLVSGIDQEVFANHPWFNYNVNIIN